MNLLTQTSFNWQGIAYVASRMDWYWNFSSLLLDENMTDAHSPGLRDELEKVVLIPAQYTLRKKVEMLLTLAQ
jgi:hypothetical protein